MEIHIRKAGIEDLKHVLHHRRAMFEEMGFQDAAVLDSMEGLSREYFSEALSFSLPWLASRGMERPGRGRWWDFGCALAGYPGENRGERAWILNMYTEPGARRRGVAKRLLEMMVEWCLQRGLTAVSLHASSAGRRLYESVGFQQTDEMTSNCDELFLA